MNGLEAIELMKQGKMVVEVGTSEPFCFKDRERDCFV